VRDEEHGWLVQLQRGSDLGQGERLSGSLAQHPDIGSWKNIPKLFRG